MHKDDRLIYTLYTPMLAVRGVYLRAVPSVKKINLELGVNSSLVS